MSPWWRRLALLMLILTCMLPAGLAAHSLRSAYLELRGDGAGGYAVRLGIPADFVDVTMLTVRLEPGCTPEGPPQLARDASRQTASWTLRCPEAAGERRLEADGLAALQADLIVRVIEGERVQTGRLSPTAPALPLAGAESAWTVAATFLRLGIEHILTGYDHLLFIAALVLLVGDFRRLVVTATAFTLAHSLTLAAAVLGLVHIPPAPVEALIALSIAFVAAEIARHGEGAAGPRPWMMAFAFGLLHGLGFAGALSAIGLPQQAIPMALISFNLGVEIGQIGVIAVLLPLVALLRGLALRWPRWAPALAPYAIGSLAMLWTFERVAAFWG